jgi:hypothetical protein
VKNLFGHGSLHRNWGLLASSRFCPTSTHCNSRVVSSEHILAQASALGRGVLVKGTRAPGVQAAFRLKSFKRDRQPYYIHVQQGLGSLLRVRLELFTQLITYNSCSFHIFNNRIFFFKPENEKTSTHDLVKLTFYSHFFPVTQHATI